jgi:hypothetical protein
MQTEYLDLKFITLKKMHKIECNILDRGMEHQFERFTKTSRLVLKAIENTS